MAANGLPGAPAGLGATDVIISIDALAGGGGSMHITAGGAVGGAPRYQLELTTFGPMDPVVFLLAVAKAIRDKQSPIVRPG